MLKHLATLILLLWCLFLCDVETIEIRQRRTSTFNGEIGSTEYYKWFYRWHRGGAWMFHEEYHPCFNKHCEFAQQKSENKQGVATSEVRMFVNTTIVPQLGMVHVTFQFNEADSEAQSLLDGDFIGVYCVDNEEESERAKEMDAEDFFDYVYVDQTNLKSGIVFGPLVNMRCSYQFRYLRASANDEQYAVIGESAHVEMERGHTEPLHVRLALTSNKGEMRVMWISGHVFDAFVRYGSTRLSLHRRASASTDSYAASDLCGEPATLESARYYRHPGYIHDVVMADLVPGETYFYQVGSTNGVMSDIFEFTFPPEAGSVIPRKLKSNSQSFFVFGDLGQRVLEEISEDESPERHITGKKWKSRLSKSNTQTVMKRIEQDLEEVNGIGNYVSLVHIGDLSYAKGRTFIWDQFGAIVQPVATRLPYMIGIGNHEYDYLVNGAGHDLSGTDIAAMNGWHPMGGNFGNDSKGECGVPTVKRFHMPDNGNRVFWYSFSVGLTHHVVLSSEHPCEADAPMRVWLEKELADVDRSKTPWLLVHIHRPLYCSENYDGDYKVSHILRRCLEQLLMEHNVDVIFSGHYHAYERTCPVYQEQCREEVVNNQVTMGKARAPTHIMIGSAGAELDDIDYLPASWSVNRQQEYGYGRFHVFNATHALFEFLRTRDRVVSDSKWIISDHNWSG